MIKPYQQTLSHGCLAASLLMLRPGRYSKKTLSELEANICLRGSNRAYQYYVSGLPIEFCKQAPAQLRVFVDNNVFARILAKTLKQSRANAVEPQRITIPLLRQLVIDGPVVCHIDDHYLGDYSHVSHFIVVEKFSKQRVVVVDPFYGRRRTISVRTLENAIQSLKKHIKMCPLVYQLVEPKEAA